jgi:ribosomal protein S18 acetylase RimI-like enzyme
MPDHPPVPPIAFRPAAARDFGYCAGLYFAAMAATIRQLDLDMDAQVRNLRERWTASEVRIITRAGVDVGWLQTAAMADALFLGQLFVDAPHQRQGIGTDVMRLIIAEAAQAGQAVTLGVVKGNEALRLYRRLGFTTTHEDSRKFYLRRERDAAAPPAG